MLRQFKMTKVVFRLVEYASGWFVFLIKEKLTWVWGNYILYQLYLYQFTIHIMFPFDPLKVLIVAYTHFIKPIDVDGVDGTPSSLVLLLLDTPGSSWCGQSNGFRRFLRRCGANDFAGMLVVGVCIQGWNVPQLIPFEASPATELIESIWNAGKMVWRFFRQYNGVQMEYI